MEQNGVTNREECLKRLADLTINYKLYEHEPVVNME